jgi:signal transduction histidine kinase
MVRRDRIEACAELSKGNFLKDSIMVPPLRVLNVDDDDAARYTKSRMLRAAGFDVLDASSGSEALEILFRARPHLVVLDVKLPDIDGFELCRRIKSDPRVSNTPLIQISAVYVSDMDEAIGLAHGADIYLRFPIDPLVLTTVVETVAKLGRVRETILDGMWDAYFAFDRDWRFTCLNRRAADQMKRLGMDPVELIGKLLWDVFPAVPNEALLRRVMSERVVLTDELYYEPLGEWLENHMYPTDDGGVANFQRVVTDRKRSEQAVRASQEAAENLTRVLSMGELMGTLTHHVNQPLGAVVINAYAALKWLKAATPELDEVRSALENIVRDAHRAGDVIRRMLELVTRGPIVSVDFNPGKLILDALPLLHHEANARGVSIQMSLAPDLPQVRGDPVQLQQVVLYLAINAIEAMSGVTDRTRVLGITIGRFGTRAVYFAFRDSGPGFDPKCAPEIFEPLYTSKPGSLGMGLAISRTIVQAHGGQLRNTRNTPAGATFEFTLASIANGAEDRAEAPAGFPVRTETAPAPSGSSPSLRRS